VDLPSFANFGLVKTWNIYCGRQNISHFSKNHVVCFYSLFNTIVRLDTVIEVLSGQQTLAFRNTKDISQLEAFSFSLVTERATLDLICSDLMQTQTWFVIFVDFNTLGSKVYQFLWNELVA
jgi:hypothetical protein